MTRAITFEEHQKIAGQLLPVLEGIESLWQLLSEIASDPTATPAKRRAAGKFLRKVHATGRAAQKVQMACETDLSAQDHSDRRSWPLYFPTDRPGATGIYG